MQNRYWDTRTADRGVMGILVTILLSTGVLLGTGAIVVDVGQIYAERAQLQTEADNAALSAARSCGTGACDASTLSSVITQAADVNSRSNTSNVSSCGYARPDTGLPGQPGCGAAPTGRTACAGTRPVGENYIEAQSATRTADGKTVLPPVFGRAVLGSGYQGTTVHSCARARWGRPTQLSSVVGLALSVCAVQNAIGAIPTYDPGPPYYPFTFNDHAIYAKSSVCGNGPGGMGNIAWLDGTTACTRSFVTGTPYPGTPLFGGSLTTDAGCQAALWWIIFQPGTVYYLPVFQNATSTGSGKADYTIVGYVQFHFTSAQVKLFGTPPVNPTSIFPCWINGPDCISGFLSRATVAGRVMDGPDFGVTTSELTG